MSALTSPPKVDPRISQGLAELITGYLNEQLALPKEQIQHLGNRVETLEARMDRESLTRSQSRALQRAVANRVYAAVKELGDDSAAQHFANVYGSLKDRYNVGSYLDIPRNRFTEAMGLVNSYDGSGRNWWHD